MRKTWSDCSLRASISGKTTLLGPRGSYWNLCRSVPYDLMSQHRQRPAWPRWETLRASATWPLAVPSHAGVDKTTASAPAALTMELDGLQPLYEGSGKSRGSVNTPPPCPRHNCCHPPGHRASRAGDTVRGSSRVVLATLLGERGQISTALRGQRAQGQREAPAPAQ